MRAVWVDGSAEAALRLRGAVADALDGGPAVLPLNASDPRAPELLAAMAPDEPVEPHTAVLIATSGSTGAAKGVLLSAGALTASATATHDRLGGPGSWLLATPAQYIGGLQVLVRGLIADTPTTVLDLSAGFRPEAFAEAAASMPTGPRYTALVPTQLARIMDAGGQAVRAAAGFDAVVLGGAALDTGLRAQAERAGLRVVSAYGMSETASGCVYDGVPLDGVHVRLGADARIEVAGDVLTHGYRLSPELSAEALAGGWFRTGDVGEFDADRRLRVLGRADDVINTGGVKVPASAVERVLLAQPGVRAACVVGLPDPEWGEIVVAAAIPDRPLVDEWPEIQGAKRPLVDEWRARVRAELGAAAAPKRIALLDELPLRGPGKVDKTAVRTLLAG